MFKTIFSRLMITTLITISLSFLAAGVLLYGFLVEYAISEKEKTLRHYAERIIEMEKYLVRNNNLINREIFKLNVEAYGEDSSSIIFIIDNSGEIMLVSLPQLRHLEGERIEPQLVESLREGKEIKIEGNLGNLLNETFLILGYPIKYNGRIIGSVILNTPLPELQRLSWEVYSLFLKAVGISAVIAVIFIYLMSRRISHPLRDIGRVARQIAGGNFKARVRTISNDEIGELGRTFNYMAEALNNLEQVRKNFIANVSHELRTPLTSVAGFVEGMMDGTIPADKQQHYLSIVKQEVVRLTKLVNDILDLAKVESGEAAINPRVFNISELIKKSTVKFENQVSSKNINLKIGLEDEDQPVLADPDAIERVITNLLDNAVKFTPEGGIINITAYRKDQSVYIRVEDNGEGIDKDDLPYIWERFFKTDKSRSKDKTGTGLGLAIVKNIVQRHNQNIWVESELNRGSVFIFTLEAYDGS